MTLTDQQRQAILDEIVAMGQPRRQRDFEFRRRDYQERTGLTQPQAKGALDRMVDAGQLKAEMAFEDGHWLWVYWRPQDEEAGADRRPGRDDEHQGGPKDRPDNDVARFGDYSPSGVVGIGAFRPRDNDEGRRGGP